MSKTFFNPLEHSICLDYPLWLDDTAWAQHIPFAMFLTSVMRPQTLVELGSWRGVSYCAFCQAVKTLKFETKCFAVDTWQGDEHAGFIKMEVLTKLRTHHDPLYGGFSRLVQSTFENALTHFADNSIDLLHIDGFHTYDAVKHDFETWLPKMSERGVVLFHDTNVRERGFGVWQFWQEKQRLYPNFEFLHGHGLGVLFVGNSIVPENLRFLFQNDGDVNLIRNYFYTLGSRIDNALQITYKENFILEQQKYIETLQTYENVVQKSRTMRIYRIVRDEGFGSLLKKSVKGIN